jgi:sialate O-acetylesterase
LISVSVPRLLLMRLAPLLAGLSLGATAFADVTPAPLFRDGAVLQRDQPLPVWGLADPGENVSVAFAGQTASTTAGADGRWSVTLKALEASSASRDLTIKGRNTVVVRDVLVGEVWLASGQSNMEWPLAYSANAKAEIAAANHPLVRQFKAAKTSAAEPAFTVEGEWTPALPATAGRFSGVAYYFAVDLHRSLKVPVGILNSSWGGTGIDPWISPDAHRSTPELAKRFEQSERAPRPSADEAAAHQAAKSAWEKARDDARKSQQPFTDPAPKAPANLPGTRTLAGLNNGMIAPLAPYALRGAIWYQGESNTAHASGYHTRMVALISGFRKQFNQPDAPFYWVQLPNFDHGNKNDDTWHWAELREAQTATLSTPRTGQAVTIDVGEAKDLHPKNKKPVGERLALLARAYGEKNVIDSGPVITGARRSGARWRVEFAPLASPLKAAPAGLTGFELAGADKIFHPAEARIEGAAILVSSAAVPDPVALRYAFRNAPEAGLFNAAGLPAAPFRPDDW